MNPHLDFPLLFSLINCACLFNLEPKPLALCHTVKMSLSSLIRPSYVLSQDNPKLFSQDPDKWRRKRVSYLKPGTCLAGPVMAWGQGLVKTVTSDPENPSIPCIGLWLSVQGCCVFTLWYSWDILCFLCTTLLDWFPGDYVLLCDGFFLTLYHSPIPTNSM